MTTPDHARWRNVIRHIAEAVPAFMLSAMFIAFIVQVVMRYVLRQPVGWTVEVCILAWIWIIFWGQSVSASEEDEIRFDIIYSGVSKSVKRWMKLAFSLFLVTIYAISLPAVWDYVTFMKIEKTSYMKIPYNWVFSVFLIFTVVSILRYAWIFITSLRRETPYDVRR